MIDLEVDKMPFENNKNSLLYPKVSDDYSVSTVSIIKPALASHCYNLCAGQDAIFFSRNDSVWKVYPDGVIEEYIRIQDELPIAGIAFDHNFELFVLTSAGTLFQIANNKKGRTVASLSSFLDVDHSVQMCDLSYGNGVLCASVQLAEESGILRIAPSGSWMWISRTTDEGTQGISVTKDKMVWSVESKIGKVLKRRPIKDSKPILSVNIDNSNSLMSPNIRDGRICNNSDNCVFFCVGAKIFKLVTLEPRRVELIADGVKDVTGMCYMTNSLYVLEAGAARILELSSRI